MRSRRGSDRSAGICSCSSTVATRRSMRRVSRACRSRWSSTTTASSSNRCRLRIRRLARCSHCSTAGVAGSSCRPPRNIEVGSACLRRRPRAGARAGRGACRALRLGEQLAASGTSIRRRRMPRCSICCSIGRPMKRRGAGSCRQSGTAVRLLIAPCAPSGGGRRVPVDCAIHSIWITEEHERCELL